MLSKDVIELALQVLETAAVVIGVVFALLQVRALKVQHEVQGGAALLNSLQSRDTGSTALLLYALPDGLDGAALKQRLGADFDAVIALASMFESLGPLVARGHVPVEIYADYYRGLTVLCWRRLRRYVEEERAAAGWSNLFEWLQWLAERMDERAPLARDVPAFERYRDWRSPADFPSSG
jgi:hypothetical protein